MIGLRKLNVKIFFKLCFDNSSNRQFISYRICAYVFNSIMKFLNNSSGHFFYLFHKERVFHWIYAK